VRSGSSALQLPHRICRVTGRGVSPDAATRIVELLHQLLNYPRPSLTSVVMASSVVWAIGAVAAAFTSFFSANAGSDLQNALSRGAEVYYPGSEGFANATTRWSAHIQPEFDVVVRVKTEEDVQNVVSATHSPRTQQKLIGKRSSTPTNTTSHFSQFRAVMDKRWI
jgi:ABC-type taurine transport system substrate-binding protein